MASSKKMSRKALGELSQGEFLKTALLQYGRLLRFLKPYTGRLYTGLFFAICSGLFYGVLLLSFKIIFSLVLPSNDPSSVSYKIKVPVLGEFDYSAWIPKDLAGSQMAVLICCLAVPALIGVRGALEYIAAYCRLWVTNRVTCDLRNEVFASMMKQSLSYYNRSRSGDLVQMGFMATRIATNCALTLAEDWVKHPVAILTTLAVLITWDPMFAFIALVVFPLCLAPVVILGKKVRSAGGKEEESGGAVLAHMQETFSGIRVVKAYAREDYERKRFNQNSRKLEKMLMRWGKAMEIVGPMVETVASLGIAGGLYYAWYYKVPLEDFLLCCMALMQMYPAAKSLSRSQMLLTKGIVATSNVFNAIHEVPDIRDPETPVPMPRAKGAITFDQVFFQYPKTREPSLKEVSFHMDPGKMYALVGPSGAGKSTIFGMMLRFYDPLSGSVRLDNIDLQQLKQTDLREQIALVNQDIFLFHDTIANNIRYGRLDATDEEIVEAAKRAFAHDFILEKPEGYDSVVGDKGCLLSGGQQQRICLARAFLRNAPILLLDEATSALDTESEQKIKDAIQDLRQGRTVVAIAHRLSTVLESDSIIVMQDGYLIDQGSHQELLYRCPLYQRLYQSGFQEADLEIDTPPLPFTPPTLSTDIP